MADRRPMNRLLQGDVGSGKTAVALYAAMVAVQSGHQATIMAPTEVLAAQHLRSAQALLTPLGARNVLHGTSGRRPRDARSPDDQTSLFAGARRRTHRAERPPAPHVRPADRSVTGKDRERVLEGIRDGASRRGGRHPRAGAGGRGVRRPVAGGDRRAAPVRRAPAHPAEGEGRGAGRPDHDRDADPADARPHLLRRPRRVASSTSCRPDGSRSRRSSRGRSRNAATPTDLVREEVGGGPAGVRRVRGDRRGEPRRGEGRGEGGRSPCDGGVPGPPHRAAARPHAPGREGGAHGGVPGRARPTSSSRRR